MRIVSMEIEGYRSLRQVTWQPGALNVIVGPNGVGKSNLARALWHVSRAARMGNDLGDSLGQAGGFPALLWNSNPGKLRFSLRGQLEFEDPCEFVYDLVIQPHGNGWQIGNERLCSVHSGSPQEIFSRSRGLNLAQQSNLDKKGPHGDPKAAAPMTSKGAILSKRATEPTQAWLAWYPAWLSESKANPFGELTSSVRSWQVWQGAQIESAASRSSHEPDNKGEEDNGLASVILRLYGGDIEFRRDFDRGMSVAFDNYQGLSIDMMQGGRANLGVKWRALRPMLLPELSDGTVRYMSLLTLLMSPEPPRLLWLDQPETGLHPAMLPLIAEFAHAASARCQLAIATHSVELLRYLSAYNPTVTAAKLVEGRTQLSRVDGAALEGWIEQYTKGRIGDSSAARPETDEAHLS